MLHHNGKSSTMDTEKNGVEQSIKNLVKKGTGVMVLTGSFDQLTCHPTMVKGIPYHLKVPWNDEWNEKCCKIKLVLVLMLYQIIFGQVDAATPVANCTPLPDGNLTCAISFNSEIIYNSKISLQTVNQNDEFLFQALHTPEYLSSVPGSVVTPNPDWTNNGLKRLLNNRRIESFTTIYSKNMQKVAIQQQCGPQRWFDDDQKIATFHDFNAAPQWQIFNNGYWFKVEESIRKLVKGTYDRPGTPIKVMSGCYDQLTCSNAATQETLVYLNNTQRTRGYVHFLIPIPKVFYKVVKPFNSIGTRRSILIVTINHPTMTKGQVESYFEQNFCIIQHDICDIFENTYSVSPYDWFKPSGFKCNKGLGDNFSTTSLLLEAKVQRECGDVAWNFLKFRFDLRIQAPHDTLEY
uniref:CSON000815 protein n=1 Tax=Culicoides sonorensis TaxID=179676 RepID=A0A336MJB7_CULSO